MKKFPKYFEIRVLTYDIIGILQSACLLAWKDDTTQAQQQTLLVLTVAKRKAIQANEAANGGANGANGGANGANGGPNVVANCGANRVGNQAVGAVNQVPAKVRSLPSYLGVDEVRKYHKEEIGKAKRKAIQANEAANGVTIGANGGGANRANGGGSNGANGGPIVVANGGANGVVLVSWLGDDTTQVQQQTLLVLTVAFMFFYALNYVNYIVDEVRKYHKEEIEKAKRKAIQANEAANGGANGANAGELMELTEDLM
ncbi:hypothetical protein COLO4_21942 [Corchorus olitorius]|uniref:Uncharacterized protein n=1 Tax=Corchorus olitorius TaxID=93759 RepID=A0A1R3IQ30_9ROSI|nr:hypothetical protein COLO4_21942 [Corchorus olitorius]